MLVRLTGVLCFIAIVAVIIVFGPTLSGFVVVADTIPYGNYLVNTIACIRVNFPVLPIFISNMSSICVHGLNLLFSTLKLVEFLSVIHI